MAGDKAPLSKEAAWAGSKKMALKKPVVGIALFLRSHAAK
jgi:hypothetical protein